MPMPIDQRRKEFPPEVIVAAKKVPVEINNVNKKYNTIPIFEKAFHNNNIYALEFNDYQNFPYSLFITSLRRKGILILTQYRP